MNWKWIGILSCLSVVTSLLTVYGVMPTGPMAYVVSFAAAIVISFIFVKMTPDKFFKNGFTLGLVGGTVGTLVQLLLFNTMMEHNTEMATKMENMPANMNPVVMMAAFAPIGILLSGAIQGFFCWIIASLMGKNSKKRVSPPPAVS